MTIEPIDAVVLAAGRGARLGGATPKQYLPLGAETVLARAVDAFLDHPRVRRVIVVIGADDDAALCDAIGPRAARVEIVTGGATRQASVRAALDHLTGDAPARVLIHDGARPFVSAALIGRVIDALAVDDAVIPGLPVADTLKRVEGEQIAGTVSRDALVAAQTPQGFAFAPLLAAHHKMLEMATDDAGVMEAAGYPVRVVMGERENFKITTIDDLEVARAALPARPAIGQGFDVHRIVPGGPMILGGLTLDLPYRLSGHSDADVALHALTDAIFGAIADGDIGHHFPPSDEAWKGAASDQFLAFAADRAKAVGEIAHLDLTIICEKPKIGPLREAMRERIAEITGLPVARIAVKATTTERLGFAGRGEGIAAQAVATVLLR
ncbi:bifunctional 2-C-methyl-D-erythritol 4-phosphate cytidylyltransferase/2-C-methyl-D-erythritol 2,4-cyclodiphosphate synthase [Acuticoccus sp. M5D2P5]|uniref:bifunctional 2-C-methyl-D-erythritol 4-phosphate cytidylyltransferase/2-C-methyl-D-erythritol 2,4-cyclodiphosphate synthase n=1 Tax=Acuticoccus kalidii TaxID=2910977 RepID=UPI001F2B0F74|nr:bifunctional 2-C-methyl-D-erythritol 4-phosphate cytidylyltransferase/2-C-methyl-D-erythritol 2,4-cyclodiphosphate synthase [Acuticoccus kalidii]MCF3932659.1 bifunctional 2-C-methyl-D-erythritol 4-phosphate cytidylyltransferase/2-C-methyl-D-erythritol 2,4-cyclodiphosphate synthase [Acuticoccus kalidii]